MVSPAGFFITLSRIQYLRFGIFFLNYNNLIYNCINSGYYQAINFGEITMQNSQFSFITNILFTVILLLFANVSFAGGLNSDEAKVLITGKTVESESARGFPAKTYYSPDGTYRKSKRDELTKGVWYIDSDGKLCRRIDGETTATCLLIVKKSDVWKLYKVPSKPTKPWKHKTTFIKITDGNPNNL
ncbi:MAG: hypothetical protein GQ546_07050 [Gammaproteobacteria bacterium]|nr:hypothetical protein [Gammaproteobacteria bacterium]